MKTELSASLIRTTAKAAYSLARIDGRTPAQAAQVAWMTLRSDLLRHLRAPNGLEQISHNSGCYRDYCSPLGCYLGLGTSTFGSHSTKYPRTLRSRRESNRVAATVIAHLEAAHQEAA